MPLPLRNEPRSGLRANPYRSPPASNRRAYAFAVDFSFFRGDLKSNLPNAILASSVPKLSRIGEFFIELLTNE